MKRIIAPLLCAAAAVALALAGYEVGRRSCLRVEAEPVYSSVERDPMADFRLEREQLRARQESQLNDIIHSGQSDGEIVTRAQEQLLELLAATDMETTLEGLLLSRGFGDVLVSIRGGSANVLVRSEAMTQRETAVILELVMRQTGLTGGNVKIIPVK